MKALLAAFIALAVLPVFAEEFVEIPGLQCRGNVCIMPRDVLGVMIQTHNEHIDEIRALKAEKSKPPKCAEVEITEPSKNAPPKKLPYIPRESDS